MSLRSSGLRLLPEREQARWVGVVAELLKAAEHGGPFPFIARVAFSRALHGISGVGPIPEQRDQNAAWKAKRAAKKKAVNRRRPT